MVKKEFTYKGKTVEELRALSNKELAALLPASARRKINRGFTEQEQLFLKSVQNATRPVETHCRDMLVLPMMIDKTIKVHRGNQFVDVMVVPEMVGHRLGEFALSRKKAAHTVTGVGAKKAKKVR
jgi:small subunit ribosomal protein S19